MKNLFFVLSILSFPMGFGFASPVSIFRGFLGDVFVLQKNENLVLQHFNAACSLEREKNLGVCGDVKFFDSKGCGFFLVSWGNDVFVLQPSVSGDEPLKKIDFSCADFNSADGTFSDFLVMRILYMEESSLKMKCLDRTSLAVTGERTLCSGNVMDFVPVTFSGKDLVFCTILCGDRSRFLCMDLSGNMMGQGGDGNFNCIISSDSRRLVFSALDEGREKVFLLEDGLVSEMVFADEFHGFEKGFFCEDNFGRRQAFFVCRDSSGKKVLVCKTPDAEETFFQDADDVSLIPHGPQVLAVVEKGNSFAVHDFDFHLRRSDEILSFDGCNFMGFIIKDEGPEYIAWKQEENRLLVLGLSGQKEFPALSREFPCGKKSLSLVRAGNGKSILCGEKYLAVLNERDFSVKEFFPERYALTSTVNGEVAAALFSEGSVSVLKVMEEKNEN